MSPKFNVGEIVKVFEYYNEGIVKDTYNGLIVSVKKIGAITGKPIYIYSILPNEDGRGRTGVQTAEQFAIEELVK